MEDKFVFDTSVWIEYFLGNKIVLPYMTSSILTPTLVLAELSDKFSRKNKDFETYYEFIRLKSSIVPLNEKICLLAGPLKTKERVKKSSFGLTDALIYLTAQEHKSKLLSLDNDFRDMFNAVVLK